MGVESVRRRRERGSAAILVTASLLLLAGIAAMALDGGSLYSERRQAQNAADHSALAAAYAECTGASVADAQAAGLAAAAVNGFDNAANNTVTVTRQGAYEYRSTIDSDIDGTFSNVLGQAVLGTGATAVASCAPGAIQGEALFANGSGCSQPELYIEGNTLSVDGGAHSNEDIEITGENHTISGLTTYVDPPGTFPAPSSTNVVTASPVTTTRSYPIDFDIADYRPGGSLATVAGSQYSDVSVAPVYGTWASGKWTVPDGTALAPGIYYSPGQIEVGNNVTVTPAAAGDVDGVTFVAENRITFKDPASFSAWGHADNQDLVVFSNHDGVGSCTEIGVALTGNTNVFNGIILAKYSVASVQGNSASAFGGVWGYRVEVKANGTILSGPLIGSGGDPELTFDE